MASVAVSGLRLDSEYVSGNKRKAKSPSVGIKRARNDNNTINSDDTNQESEEELAQQYFKFQNSARRNANDEEVFCVCRRPDHGGELMISCDGCDEWFHFKCMKIDTEDDGLIDKFYCKFCQWKGIGETMWKRHCRLASCRNAIVSESKYCCKEHGLEYIRLQLERVKDSYNPQKLDFKRVVEATDGLHLKLTALGASFPELPQVVEYWKTHDPKLFPDTIRYQLETIDESIEQLTAESEQKEFLLQFLAKYKEKVKLTNELYTQKMAPGEGGASSNASANSGKQNKRKSKQPKIKKYEICLYQSDLNLENPTAEAKEYMNRLVQATNVQEEFNTEITDIVNAMIANETEQEQGQENEEENASVLEPKSNAKSIGNICMKDRKKCIRHNGWWNLMVDKYQKEINETNLSIELLQKETKKLLRDYSIKEYEKSQV